MDKLPISLEVLLVAVFIPVIQFISKKSDRLKVGGLALIGMLLILLPQARGDFTSLGFLIGMGCSFIGIILIILDKKDNKLSSKD